MMSSQPFRTLLAAAPAAVLDAWAVLMPTDCSGCGAVDRALCSGCAAALRPAPALSTRNDLTIWSALEYRDVAARVLLAYKDGGRTDAAPALAGALRAAVGAALAAAPTSAAPGGAGRPPAAVEGVLLVAVPSSRRAWRARGFAPVELLLRRAELRPVRLLRPGGRVADQVGLGRQERLDNRTGALVPTRRLAGHRVLLVDDIVTTGATLLDARRAIRLAGGEVIGAATVAETRRRHPVTESSPETD
ncbi:ComF family protein [Cryobacterium arcticum]|uniref:Competence protein F n=1 Tax=Cryobacterium arcticum TaxID=670052 RepID=A0A1B1BGL9_9MICO|nr:phosphoribosyltransferase family protein [Cryobacterium arcticum]ANP71643.1 Competence protein F [Cryobacterium arcticum]